MTRPITKNQLTNYWLTHYATEYCTLCGNSSVIDTRSVRTLAGNGRKNWCICPNGQVMRKQYGSELPPQ